MSEDLDAYRLSDNPIINEAKKRWNRVAQWESQFRVRFIEDVKFANGDSDNGYQWPQGLRAERDIDNRPCLTLNVIAQHNKMISNEMRKNKSSVKIVGMGNGATSESAMCLNDIITRIENRSHAQTAYTIARKFQIDGGIGWFRLITDYASNNTLQQEIFIRPVMDPLSVYMDPDCKELDCSDAKWAFVFDEISKADFEEEYPAYKGKISQNPLGIGTDESAWISKEDIRVCEYFRKVEKDDWVYSYVYGGERHVVLRSQLPKNIWKDIEADSRTVKRKTKKETIEHYFIVGETIVEEETTIWPGKYIPLIPVLGETLIIEGMLDRKGHTRAMKDPQRMLNWNASSEVEYVSMQGKTPWTGSVESIEEYEDMWGTANKTNHSFLAFKHRDSEGEPIPPQALPHRIDPPNASPAFQLGMETAQNHMMLVSGQWQNQMGMMGNERTGEAISQRQQQSDTATFHFQDNYEDALLNLGRQLIDLIPKVYDTERVFNVLANDGTDITVKIDPNARKIYEEELNHRGEVVARIFNPNLGDYEVAPSVGPAYGTRMEQTREAFSLILTQNPGLTGIIGDLLLESMEFDKAQEAALRLKRMVPPVALGTGPTANEQALQQQVQALEAALAQSLQRQAKDQIKLVGKEEMRDIDVYEAETKRLDVLGKLLPMDQAGLEQLVHQLVGDAVKTHLSIVVEDNDARMKNDEDVPDEALGGNGEDAPPIEGAKKAGDGEWYVLDPTRQGKYLHVAPLATVHKPILRGLQ